MQETNQNKSLFKRNILKYLQYKGVSKYEFYKFSGISRGTLDNASGLGEENIAKFLAYAQDVNYEWLLTGKGEMLKKSPENGGNYNLDSDPRYTNEGKMEYIPEIQKNGIPLYNTRNSKDIIRLFKHAGKLVPDDFLLIPNIEHFDGACHVCGDSMYPLLKSGDILVYKVMKSKEESLFWGEMYLLVIQVEDEAIAVLNYVQKSEKGTKYVALTSFNAKYESKDIRLDQIQAFALVKASVRMSN